MKHLQPQAYQEDEYCYLCYTRIAPFDPEREVDPIKGPYHRPCRGQKEPKTLSSPSSLFPSLAFTS
jgi:hypothetical protein